MLRNTPSAELKKLVTEAIKIASNVFTPGSEIYHFVPKESSPQFKKLYASSISDTNWIATHGPTQRIHVADFIEELVYNPTTPVHAIFALGDKLGMVDSVIGRSFHNYFNFGVSISEDTYHNAAGTYHYKIETDATDANDIITYHADYIKPTQLLKTTLRISRKAVGAEIAATEFSDAKVVELFFMPVIDNKSFVLTEEVQEQLFLWRQKSLEPGHVAVHCQAGVGRTGQLIFLMRLLEKFDSVFAGDDPQQIAKNIIIELDHIRRERPSLVYTNEQFLKAIEFAVDMHFYCLNKALETPAKVERVITPNTKRARSATEPNVLTPTSVNDDGLRSPARLFSESNHKKTRSDKIPTPTAKQTENIPALTNADDEDDSEIVLTLPARFKKA